MAHHQKINRKEKIKKREERKEEKQHFSLRLFAKTSLSFAVKSYPLKSNAKNVIEKSTPFLCVPLRNLKKTFAVKIQ